MIKKQNVVFVDMTKVIREVNRQNIDIAFKDTAKKEPWINPEDWLEQFFYEQEYGTSCYMEVKLDADTLEEEQLALEDYEECGAPEEYLTQKVRLKIFEFLRSIVAPNEKCMVYVEY